MFLTRKNARNRRGFTLVELMVAAALAITIMWILSESFKMGIDFARNAHSTGDMMTQLNNAGQILSRDLQAPHFLLTDSPPVVAGAMRNASTSATIACPMPDTLTANLNPNTAVGISQAGATGYAPPNGYFMLVSPPPLPNAPTQSYASFPDDAEFFTISTTNPATTGWVPGSNILAGAQLAFTVFLPQGLPQNQFVATSNGQIYYSRAGEVGYFLGSQHGAGTPVGFTPPMSDVTTGLALQQKNLNAAGQPLYNLYRRYRLVAENSDFAQLKPKAAFEPPNLNAAVQPTSNGLPNGPPNPYYDPTAGDVISFTQVPAAKPTFIVNQMSTFSTAVGNNALQQVPPSRFGPVGITNGLVPLAPLTTPGRVGDDILLTNVLSFEVLASWVPAPYPFATPTNTNPNLNTGGIRQPPSTPKTPPQAIPGPRPFTVANPTPMPNLPGAPNYAGPPTKPFNSNYPFDYLPQLNLNSSLPNTFDTWFKITKPNGIWNDFSKAPNNPWLIPMPARITGLQITIRIYDPKTNQARQNTWRIAM